MPHRFHQARATIRRLFRGRPTSGSPDWERDRLAFLKSMNILDSSPELFSDAMVGAAAAIANTPIAALSLVDGHRQWFKGACGLEISETPREVSFCSHAIQEDGPMIVEDARQDPRFRDHEAVTGAMSVRFYAGFPVIVQGRALGALCVVDDHPRKLSRSQVARLENLADGTAAWIAQRARCPAA